jgi:hypothetical protein
MQTVTLETISPLRDFIVAMTKLVEKEHDEATVVSHSKGYLKTLINPIKNYMYEVDCFCTLFFFPQSPECTGGSPT